MPLLLVKQFAFDLEFLAVANALGFRRIREQPVNLDYRFTGRACGRRPCCSRSSTRRRSSTGSGSSATTSASVAPAGGTVAHDELPAARHARRRRAAGARLSASSTSCCRPRSAEARTRRRPRRRGRGRRLPRGRRDAGAELAREHRPVSRQPGDRRGRDRKHDAGPRLGARAGRGRAAESLPRRRLALLPLHAREPPLRPPFPGRRTSSSARPTSLRSTRIRFTPNRLCAALDERGPEGPLHAGDGRRRAQAAALPARTSARSRRPGADPRRSDPPLRPPRRHGCVAPAARAARLHRRRLAARARRWGLRDLWLGAWALRGGRRSGSGALGGAALPSRSRSGR